MHALKTNQLREIGEANDPRTGGKPALDGLIRDIAIARVLGDQLLYELHGPYVPSQPEHPRRPMIIRVIQSLSRGLHGLARRFPKRRAADMDVRLDNALLKDIGVTRSEIEFAIGFADPRS